MLKLGVIVSIINAKEIEVEDSYDGKRYICEVPVSEEEDISEDHYISKNINSGLKVAFFLPKIYNGRGYVTNFYKSDLNEKINIDKKENSLITRVMKSTVFKVFFDGSFYISSFNKIFGIFYDASGKKLNIATKKIDISTANMSITSSDIETLISIGSKLFNINIESKEGIFTLKDSIGDEMDINNLGIKINTNNRKIKMNGLNISKDKITFKKLNNSFEMSANYVKIINGNSKIYIGKSGVEISNGGNGIFLDRKGKLQLQSNKINLLSKEMNIKSDKTKMSSTIETGISSSKIKISDSTGTISPLIIRKVFKKVNNVISLLKPISPQGPCTPDISAASKLETVNLEMRREAINVSLREEATKNS